MWTHFGWSFPLVQEGEVDHVAVNGATATLIPIAVGLHFENRGMRPDQHDALGLELRVAGGSQPGKEAADQKAERNCCYAAAAALTNTRSDERELQQRREIPALQQQKALGQGSAEQPASARADPPLGLAWFLNRNGAGTKSSTENTREATTGSNRGAAESAGEPVAEPAKEAVPMEQSAVDRAREGAASLVGPGDSQLEPVLSADTTAHAALQPDSSVRTAAPVAATATALAGPGASLREPLLSDDAAADAALQLRGDQAVVEAGEARQDSSDGAHEYPGESPVPQPDSSVATAALDIR